jgi:hypothetical protein
VIKAPGAINNLRPSRLADSPLVEAFDRQGVDPLVPYVGGTGAQMASSVSHMTLGGIPLSEAAAKTIQQARAARDRIAAKMGWVKDGMGAGSTAQRGARAFVAGPAIAPAPFTRRSRSPPITLPCWPELRAHSAT